MKFLHTSDLHLGKKVYETSMIEDQRYILEEILGIIRKEEVDALLLPGDIYDKTVSSEEAVSLLDWFLDSLHDMKCPVYIIPGNHDSAGRLSFVRNILNEENVHISGAFDQKMERYVVEDDFGPLNIWLLPFFRDVAVKLPDDVQRNPDAAFRKVLENSGFDPKERNVLLSHQFFLSKGCPLDVGGSERQIPSVGGEDCISSELLEGFDYVALGHIHKAQKVGRDTVRYSGSPLKYSEKENFNDKSVAIVDVKGKGDVEWKLIGLSPLRDLRIIEGTVEGLIDEAKNGSRDPKDYVYIRLTEPAADAKQRLSQAYPNILSISMSSYAPDASLEDWNIEEIRQREPLDIFREMFVRFNGKEMSPEQEKAFNRAVNEAKSKEVAQ